MEEDERIVFIETIVETEIYRSVERRRPPTAALNAIGLTSLTLILALFSNIRHGFVAFLGWTLLLLMCLFVGMFWSAFKGVSYEESLNHESLGPSLLLICLSIIYLFMIVLIK